MNSTNMVLGLVFASIGLGYFIYGRKQSKVVVRYAGIGLMVYPYFVSNTVLMVGIGLGLLALPRLIDI